MRARPEIQVRGVPNPDAIIRRGPNDAGTYAEFKAPTEPTSTAVKRSITDARRQLDPWGGGEVFLDGRAVGLSREVAEAGLRRTIGQAVSQGQRLPDSIRIVLGDGSQITYP